MTSLFERVDCKGCGAPVVTHGIRLFGETVCQPCAVAYTLRRWALRATALRLRRKLLGTLDMAACKSCGRPTPRSSHAPSPEATCNACRAMLLTAFIDYDFLTDYGRPLLRPIQRQCASTVDF